MHESYPMGAIVRVMFLRQTGGLRQHESDQLNLKVDPPIKQSVRSDRRFNALPRKLHLVDLGRSAADRVMAARQAAVRQWLPGHEPSNACYPEAWLSSHGVDVSCGG
jgi:hypothetical protein